MTPRYTPSVTASARTAAAARPSWSILDRTRFSFRRVPRQGRRLCIPDDSRAGGATCRRQTNPLSRGFIHGGLTDARATYVRRTETDGSKLPTSGKGRRRPERGLRRERVGGEVGRGGQYPATRRAPASATASDDDAWLVEVAEGASRDAGGVPVELLGEYLPLLADAAIHGRRPKRGELDAVGLLGRRAAEQGISAGRVVQLYLSAARRLWQELPMVVRSRDREAVRAAAAAVLHVVDDAVATLAEGYADARRDLVRREETLRRELIDDLLRGDSDLGDFGGTRRTVRARPRPGPPGRAGRAEPAAARRRRGDQCAGGGHFRPARRPRRPRRDQGRAARRAGTRRRHRSRADSHPALEAVNDLGQLMHRELSRLPRGRPWRVAVGRAHPGLYGIARSYEEAREALTMAGRLHVDKPVVHAHELLIYRVLLRDQPAIVDLVQAVLSPLVQARGGAGPLLATLEAYFDTGGVATESAKRLHLSVRTVTYRLDRIKALTGYDTADPAHRFTLQAAVLGAKALNWPDQQLPSLG